MKCLVANSMFVFPLLIADGGFDVLGEDLVRGGFHLE